MSVTQRNAGRRWLSLVAAAVGTMAAGTGTLSSTGAASSGVKGNTVASCEEPSTRVDNTGTGLSGGPPWVFAASVAAWPACDTHAGERGVLPVSELKSAALVVPMTPPVMPSQPARLTTLAPTPRQPSLAAVPQPRGQSTTTYSVRFGDCLSDIATSHNIADWQQLYAINHRGISNPDLIYPGQLLRLPATQAP
jgi:nucleoid-associated protein YgaU